MVFCLLVAATVFNPAVKADLSRLFDILAAASCAFSTERYNLSYMRPDPACRTFNSSVVEEAITSMQSVIKDPDLYQRFQNSVPNSLDAAVKWKGFAASDLEEELTFLITGDINVAFSRAFSSNLAASSSNVWIQCVHSMSD